MLAEQNFPCVPSCPNNCVVTFTWLIVDADGLGLILAIVCLDTDEVGVCSVIEACPYCQHMLIGLIHSLH